jgi:hypothetical protein
MTGEAQAVAGLRIAGPEAHVPGDGGDAAYLVAANVLPDAPGVTAHGSSAAMALGNDSSIAMDAGGRDPVSGSAPVRVASRKQWLIEPGQPAPALTAGDKVSMGLRAAVSPMSILGWFSSAGYEQLFNGSPNYGTDSGAFGQRLGAAALCNSSEGIFSTSLMAPLLREDPRYYRMGPGHNFFLRLVYSGTRTLITRTDGGNKTPNFALILGNAEGSALTNTYYPEVNRGATETMKTLGYSIGGSAVGFVVGEFWGDVVQMFHGNKK